MRKFASRTPIPERTTRPLAGAVGVRLARGQAVQAAISFAAFIILVSYAVYLALGGPKDALSNMECAVLAIIGSAAALAFVVDE